MADELIKAKQKASKSAKKQPEKKVPLAFCDMSVGIIIVTIYILKGAKGTAQQPGKNAAKSIGQAKAKRSAAADKVTSPNQQLRCRILTSSMLNLASRVEYNGQGLHSAIEDCSGHPAKERCQSPGTPPPAPPRPSGLTY